MRKDFKQQLMTALGHEPDAIESILVDTAVKYHHMADMAYAGIDMGTSNGLGAATRYTKATQELFKTLKLLGLIHSSTSKQNGDLQTFFNKKKSGKKSK